MINILLFLESSKEKIFIINIIFKISIKNSKWFEKNIFLKNNNRKF